MSRSDPSRTRILLLLPSLHGGGAERVAMLLMQHVDPARFDVRMGLLHKSGPYVAQLDQSRLETVTLGERYMDFDQGNDKIYRPTSLLPAIVLTPTNVVLMLRRFQPDVVLSFRKGMSIITLGAILLYGRSKLRWIAREGNNTIAVIHDELKSKAARRTVEEFTAWVYGSADRLLTICHEMEDDLTAALGLDRRKLRTIHNAVDLAEVSERAAEEPEPELALRDPYVIAVGRLERQKGIDVLLHAFAESAHRTTHRLLLVGRGSHEQQLQTLATDLGIADRVTFAGWQDNPWSLMQRASLFVLPSRWEGFGNVVIEAMACGAPVAVSDCSYGPKEIVQNGVNGLVFPVDDATATTRAIDRVLGNPELAARLAAAGKQRARDFDVPVIVGRYEALFDEVAAELRDGR